MSDTMTEPRADAQAEIAERFRTLKAAEPGLRARDAAERLGISEGELVAARVDGADIRVLALGGAGFAALIGGLREVGRVMTLTRNASAVHETHGTFEHVGVHGTTGGVVGPIQLRVFLEHWHAGFAVTEETRSGRRSSFQVFDGAGDSIIKIYAVDETNRDVWDRLRDGLCRMGEARPEFAPLAARAPERPDSEIDRAALRDGWHGLGEIHDFYGLLRTVGVRREQAFRLAGRDFTRQVAPDVVRPLLDRVVAGAIPIMCFVGNRGCVQIQAGPVENIVDMGPWLNILDPGFNLHLRDDHVTSAWVVNRPTRLNDRISSLELFDSEGTLLCQFFGARSQGQTQPDDWWKLIDELPERGR